MKELTAEATVVALVTKSFEYTGDKIQMEGLADGLALTVDTPSVTATAGGTAEVIDGLTSADIALTCDLSQLAAGTHQVQVTASCGKALHTLIVEPQSIQVTVTPEVAEQPQ